MKKVLLSTVLLLALLSSSGCYKDADNSSEIMVITERPDIKIGTSIHGVVTDQNGTQLSDYDVVISNETFAVDQEVYNLSLTQVNKKNQHLSFMKDGKEIAFANVSLIENDNNKVNITALPVWNTSQLNSSKNNIQLDNNYQIEINASELSTAQETTHGITADPKLLKQMGLWGSNATEQDYFLSGQSAFFLDAENLKLGTNSLQLNYDRSSIATQTVSLFHLNENFHQWILVGELSAGSGTIALPALGYYLIADKTPSAFVEGNISYENLPLAFQSIDLSIDNNKSIQVTASANGRWASFLPKDILSVLTINDPCGEFVAEEDLNILEDGQTFATALTNANTENLIPLNFQSIKCDGELVNAPGTLVEFGATETLMLFPTSSVQIAVLSCGEIIISGYDVTNNNQGPGIPWNAQIEDQLEYLSTCEDFNEGFSFLKINGEMELLSPFTLTKENGRSILRSAENDIRIIIQGEQIGNYKENEVNFYIDDEDFGEKGYRMYCENSPVGCGINDCYISHYEDVGNGLTRVTFSGTLWMQTIQNPTAGNYEVQGQIITTL